MLTSAFARCRPVRMTEQLYPNQQLTTAVQNLEELRRESQTLVDPQERARAHQENRRLAALCSQYESQIELFDALPDLWMAIYGEVPGFLALFSGERQSGRLHSTESAFFAWPSEPAQAVQWARIAAAAAREVYMCGHLLTAPVRRKHAAAPLWALYADLDAGHIPEAVAAPSIVVQSSPGRLQCYWCLHSPVAPNQAEQFNRQLGAVVGADRSGWDLTQLLRVPGTLNHKYPEAPLVRILTGTGQRYEVSEITNQLADPPLPSSAHLLPARRVPLPVSFSPDALTVSARRVWSGEAVKQTADGRIDRSAALVQIARVLYGAGLSPSQLIEALAERDVALGWDKYTYRKDATLQYGRIVRLVMAAHRRSP
jgi:hypothetical protein